MVENFYIDEWLVQPSLNRISLDDEQWKLEPKIMKVLVCLSEHAGSVVTRDFLFQEIWGDTIVVDMTLTRAISELRSIFKDSPTQPSVIETIPKRGYRLIADVHKKAIENKPASVPDAILVNSRTRSFLFYGVSIVVLFFITIFSFDLISISDSSKTYTITPYTSLKGWEYNPAYSPDGKTVAFIWRNSNDTPPQIYTKSIGDNEPIALTSSSGANFAPTWSPDGNRIAFYNNADGKVTVNSIPIFGGNESILTETSSKIAGVSWSPNGNSIAYIDIDSLNNQHAIFLLKLDTKQKSQLSFPPINNWGDGAPKFSPDGSKIAFVRFLSEGQQDIFSIDLSTQKETQLTSINSAILGFDWSEDERIILSADIDGAVNVWEFETPFQGNRFPIADLKKLPIGKDKHNPAIRGGRLMLEDWTTDVDIFSVSLSATGDNVSSPFLSSSLWELHPSFSNNGERVAFSSNRDGSYEIWISNKIGAEAKKITSFGSSLIGMPAWSPADDVLAFDSRLRGNADIYIVDDEGKGVYQFTKSDANDISPSWSKDGNWIYFASDRSGKWELWKKPISGDNPVQVSKGGGYYGQESANGSVLYFTKHITDGLWKLDLATLEEELIIPELKPTDWGNWEITDNGIYYLSRSSNPAIHFYQFSSGDTKIITPLAASIPSSDPSLAISQDGKHALIGRILGYKGDLIEVQSF